MALDTPPARPVATSEADPAAAGKCTPAPPHEQRLVLRPGVHVLRRGDDELQVGLDPAHAVVLPDRPEVRELLRDLDGSTGRTTSDPTADRAVAPADRLLTALQEAGLLVDSDVVLPLAGPLAADEATTPPPRPDRAAVAALVAQEGEEAAARLRQRAALTVEVAAVGAGLDRPAGAVRTLLAASGAGTEGGPTNAGLLVTVGEPARERVDRWMRDGVAHLVLRFVEGRCVLGPFVVPGRTACLRCVDAHHADADPDWPLLVLQHERAASRPRADGLPEPVDPVLAELVAAWAVRELLTYAEGGQPPTTATTLHLDPRLGALETRRWPRHPGCGCTWS